eukprot:TRINITY_DN3078_c0_g2_i1.p1 TRINITY_DN3078_c0_g2~~TRINITY_DN3078_c0_g2_i1.p1  ORF type:complete len:351 (-),score=73.10 TRINITY_DN3078_c0_g2_i1:823-1875(-)
MIRRPPRSTLSSSSAASDVYKRQLEDMADSLKLMIRWPEGQKRVTISKAATVGDLQQLVAEVAQIAPELQSIWFGTPRRKLQTLNLKSSIAAEGVERGEVLTVELNTASHADPGSLGALAEGEPESTALGAAPDPPLPRTIGGMSVGNQQAGRIGGSTTTTTIDSSAVQQEPERETIADAQTKSEPALASDIYQLVVETWGEHLPPDTCARIRNDIIELENKSRFEGADLICIKPVKDSPLHLEVRLTGFAPHTTLGQDLEVMARATGRYPAAVELVVEFPEDYPHSPPFIRLTFAFTLTLTLTFSGSTHPDFSTSLAMSHSAERSTLSTQLRISGLKARQSLWRSCCLN